ncbi:cysteine rich repeat-containing protein [Desulfuromonas sp. TF]|uniref:cysteine rich repeat-containing protein n=1 Tax=Desulfuromonas sp. TF TaxID=1232410 RepID=UPI0004180E38|nr:cysteine rich repeat-containing protein [Desulfuromonas sp. TF]
MKWFAFLSVMFLSFTTGPVFAADPPKETQEAVGTFLEGCEKELTTWCKEVTPGEGRILACLYAYQDKLSPRCEYALYDAAAQLERALSALSYTVNECRDDLESYCAEVKPGEGRLLDCLRENEAKVSSRCKTALKDVGLK